MDFVVIGLGLSALALLTGLTLLCLVAPRWFRKAGVPHPGDAAYARAQAGERRALGQGFLCVGAILLLATLGGISANLTDKAGAYLIASITTVAMLGLYGWDLLYRRQHPVPRRRRPARTQKTTSADDGAVPAAEVSQAPPAAQTTVARRRVLPARQRTVPVAHTAAKPHADSDAAAEAEPHVPAAVEPDSSATDAPEAHDATPEVVPEHEGAEDEAVAADATAADAEPVEDDEPADETPPASEPAEAAQIHPEPVPIANFQANGAGSASPEPEPEPEFVPNGDDRVIALFPTAAARRSRIIADQNDPDDQS